MGDLRQCLVFLESHCLLLLLVVELLVVFADGEELSFGLDHFFLVEFEKLHIAHLLLIRNGPLRLIKLTTQVTQPVLRTHHRLVDAQLNINPRWLLALLLIHIRILRVHHAIHTNRRALCRLYLMLEQVLGGEASGVVSLKEVALLHEVGDELLTEDHHVVGFDLEGHAALADLSVDQELAALVLESFLLLHEVLCKRLDLCLEHSGELVELRINDHLNDFVFVQLVSLLKYERTL